MLKDVKFRVTDKDTGETAILTLADLYGYEDYCFGGGILIKKDERIPKSLRQQAICFYSGYGFKGENEDLEITPV